MISYGELLQKSDKTLLFFNTISLKEKALKGRFGSYRKLIQKVWLDIQNNNKENILSKSNKSGEKNIELIYFALKELVEIVNVVEQIELLYNLTSEDQKLKIISKLNLILGGSIYTKNENNNNSQARNYQFELLIASKLFSSGLSNIVFKEHPDILVTVGSLKYAIECKRVFGDFETKSIKRIEEAIQQIYLIKDEIFCGLVAVDFSTKYEQGINIVAGNSRDYVENFTQSCLESDLTHIYTKSQKITKAGKNKYLIGILANISSVYIIKDNSEFGHLNELALFALNKENPIKSINFLNDFGSLKNAIK